MSAVLVLNSTMEPLNVATIARAVRLVLAGKAKVVERAGEIRSERVVLELPSVIQMLYYVGRRRKRVELTKKNVLLRDDYHCGYCGRVDRMTMTVDHVIPKSVGGKSSWQNLVAACATCNGRKRDRTPEQAGMPLRTKPHEPSFIPFLVVRRNTAPHEWAFYLNLYSISIEERVR